MGSMNTAQQEDHGAENKSTVGMNNGAAGSALSDPNVRPPPPQAKDSPRASVEDGSPRLRPQPGYIDHVTGETMLLGGGSQSPSEEPSTPTSQGGEKLPAPAIMMFNPNAGQ